MTFVSDAFMLRCYVILLWYARAYKKTIICRIDADFTDNFKRNITSEVLCSIITTPGCANPTTRAHPGFSSWIGVCGSE